MHSLFVALLFQLCLILVFWMTLRERNQEIAEEKWIAMSDSQMSMAQNKRRSQASKGKGSLYIAQYPVRWTAQSASHFFLPLQTCSFRHRSSILAKLQLRAKTKSLTFPPLSIATYSFTAESTGASMERTKMPNLRNGSKAGFEHGLT